MISTPFVATPPPRYGGTELVVWELTLGLRDAGHDVTLFTVGRSAHQSRSLYPAPVWPPEPYHEFNHAAWAIAELHALDPAPDLIHCHIPAGLPLTPFAPAPMIYTLHHQREEQLTHFYTYHRKVQMVAVSDRQRQLLPELENIACVHHGLLPARYPLGSGGGPAVFLGRLAPEKAPHVAIDIARAAGVPLIVAGAAHWNDRAYFDREVAPRLAADGVTWIGEVGYSEKVELLGNACALLFPIDWEEPFGLVMVEAMLSGTPVLATSRGSVPEIIESGVTGWIYDEPRLLEAKLRELAAPGHSFDRSACRARARERFSRSRMVSDYVALYARTIAGREVEIAPATADRA